jgi:hypothetical protein
VATSIDTDKGSLFDGMVPDAFMMEFHLMKEPLRQISMLEHHLSSLPLYMMLTMKLHLANWLP